MRITIIILLLCCSEVLQAQVKHDYHWMLGYDSDDFVPGGEGSLVDFNNSPFDIFFTTKELDMGQTNTTMSDSTGKLLFYSNGCKVFNTNHELMMNGDSINAGEVHNDQCDDAYPVKQGMIALPMPDNDSLYYLFHQHAIFITDPVDAKIDQLLYSIIDTKNNIEHGIVLEKNLTAISDTLWPGELTAVKHSNGIDWWVIAARESSTVYHKLLLTADTLFENSSQEIGLSTTLSGRGSGQAAFSPDGTRYARYNKTDQIYLFNFDRSTGELNNFQQLLIADTAYSGGLAFSPSSRFLYVSSILYVYQFDLWAADIQASKKLVATWDGFKESGIFDTNFYAMQMGPDCRIYINTTAGTSFLHVIQHPDLEGEACQVDQRAVKLPSYNARTMPHFPNYRLGATPSYPCDPTIDLPVGVEELEGEAEGNDLFSVYPNPATGPVNLKFSARVELVNISNAVGQLVGEWKVEQSTEYWQLPNLNLKEGVYYCTVKSELGSQTKPFIIMK